MIERHSTAQVRKDSDIGSMQKREIIYVELEGRFKVYRGWIWGLRSLEPTHC